MDENQFERIRQGVVTNLAESERYRAEAEASARADCSNIVEKYRDLFYDEGYILFVDEKIIANHFYPSVSVSYVETYEPGSSDSEPSVSTDKATSLFTLNTFNGMHTVSGRIRSIEKLAFGSGSFEDEATRMLATFLEFNRHECQENRKKIDNFRNSQLRNIERNRKDERIYWFKVTIFFIAVFLAIAVIFRFIRNLLTS